MTGQIFNNSETAFLSMDYQVGRVGRYESSHPGLTDQLADVLHETRANGMLVIHVIVLFRPGYPEVHHSTGAFAQVRDQGLWLEGAPAAEIHPALGPEASDVVVVKHRTGAFSGTDLDLILRSRGITNLVLAGLTTGGVVLSTLRNAADFDYRVTVLSDCCVDEDDEVHRVLVEKVFPRHAKVITAKEFKDALSNS